jgi:prepilin-type N-terminal cleavage/methylation domain-containing protein
MLNKLKKIHATKQSDEGFTIIEVMIVLAIAGLIILIVFLAVPALQRNGRNTQRKNDAGQVSSAIATHISDNAGATLDAAGLTAAIANTKLGYYTAANVFFAAPGAVAASAVATGANSAKVLTLDDIIVVPGATCNGITPTATGASARSYAIEFANETSGSPTLGCVSN